MQNKIPHYTITEEENNQIDGFKIYALKSSKNTTMGDVNFPLSTNIPHWHT